MNAFVFVLAVCLVAVVHCNTMSVVNSFGSSNGMNFPYTLSSGTGSPLDGFGPSYSGISPASSDFSNVGMMPSFNMGRQGDYFGGGGSFMGGESLMDGGSLIGGGSLMGGGGLMGSGGGFMGGGSLMGGGGSLMGDGGSYMGNVWR